jgi:ATP-dependent protease Clp ATPase subunit
VAQERFLEISEYRGKLSICVMIRNTVLVEVCHSQVDKVVQLYETMMTRHSTMIVGPSGGGKTVVIQTLVKAQTSLGLTTKLFVLNPKVSVYITETQL